MFDDNDDDDDETRFGRSRNELMCGKSFFFVSYDLVDDAFLVFPNATAKSMV